MDRGELVAETGGPPDTSTWSLSKGPCLEQVLYTRWTLYGTQGRGQGDTDTPERHRCPGAGRGRKEGWDAGRGGLPRPDLERQASGTNRKLASTAGSLPDGSGVLGPQEARLIRNLPP